MTNHSSQSDYQFFYFEPNMKPSLTNHIKINRVKPSKTRNWKPKSWEVKALNKLAGHRKYGKQFSPIICNTGIKKSGNNIWVTV